MKNRERKRQAKGKGHVGRPKKHTPNQGNLHNSVQSQQNTSMVNECTPYMYCTTDIVLPSDVQSCMEATSCTLKINQFICI